MTICRCNLRHLAGLHDSPSRVLIELNRAMAPDMRQDMFITLIYAIIDVPRNQIIFSRAGHELPLHSHHDSEKGIHVTDTVESEGIAVGLVDGELFDAVIEDKVISFEPGDTVVFYTDGVTEAANDEGMEFSSARLADTVKALRNRSCRELNQGILDSVERFAGPSGIRDDISLVSIKHLSGPEHS